MPPARPSLIVYDARNCRPGMTGVGRYALNLLRALAALPERPPIRALFGPRGIGPAHLDPALAEIERVAALFGHETHPWSEFWLRWALPRGVPAGAVYHGPAFVLPRGRQRFARVVTIHDPIVFTHPETFRPRFGWYLRGEIRAAARNAERVIVPTRAVADELAALGIAPPEKTRVIHLAPDATPPYWDAPETGHPRAAAAFPEPPASAPLILTIAGPEPRKDPATAMRAAISLRARLNAAGRGPFEWWWVGSEASELGGVEAPLLSAAEAAGFRFVPHAPAVLLRAWMERAAALVSTSVAEGFNLTLVQALAAGVPVVASDLAVHREVCGDAALWAAPGDAEGFSAALASLITNGALRASRARDAAAHGALFSWDAAARRTLGVYMEALGA